MQVANRLIEWIDSDDILEAYAVYEDLVNNGFPLEEAFTLTLDLMRDD